MSQQLCFAGMEGCAPRRSWKPNQYVLERVRVYFAAFAKRGMTIYAKRRWIASKLKMSVRTLSRYLAWLAGVGWMITFKRTPRTAIRLITSHVSTHVKPVDVARPWHITGTRIKEESLNVSQKHQEATPRKEAQKALALPQEYTQNEYGRRELNPLYVLARDAVMRARHRIEAASNPIAYWNGVIRSALKVAG